MCSQYEVSQTIRAKIKQQFPQIKDLTSDEIWQQRIYPYSSAPVILNNQNEPVLQPMRYALTPYWSKDERPKFSSYNARLDRNSHQVKEYIYNTPAWRNSFLHTHCLIPIQRFIESCSSGKFKQQMVQFSELNEEVLFAAGIWEIWKNPANGTTLQSFAILTDEPSPELINAGHDRSPVFLNIDNGLSWFKQNSLNTSPHEMYSFLKNNQQIPQFKIEALRDLKNKSLTNSPTLFD